MKKYLLVLLLLVMCFDNNLFATKWYVDDASNTNDVYTVGSVNGDDINSGTALSPFATIQYAITTATDGDTILVDAGTYNQVTACNVNKSLTILGASKILTVLDGAHQAFYGFFLSANKIITIENLTITHFGQNAIMLSGSSSDVSKVYINNIAVSYNDQHGIYLTGGYLNRFECRNSDFTFNGPTIQARAIYAINATVDTVIIEDCYIANTGFLGIDLSSPDLSVPANQNNYARVKRCTILNHINTGMSLLGYKSALIDSNVITDANYAFIEIKVCTANGAMSGPGSFVVSNNKLTLTQANIDRRDIAGIAVINRFKSTAGANGLLSSNGICIYNNDIDGFVKLNVPVTAPPYTATDVSNWSGSPYNGLAPDSLFDACGIMVEGYNHKIIGNKISNSEIGVIIQERPIATVGGTPPISTYFDANNCSPTSTANTTIKRNGFFNCRLAIKGVGLNTMLDASNSYLGQTSAAGAQSMVLTIPSHTPLLFPNVFNPNPSPLNASVPTGMIDYSPWLKNSTDEAQTGFQGDWSYLVVDDNSPRITPNLGYIQEGHDSITGTGTLTVEISPGTYHENNIVTKKLSYKGVDNPVIDTLTMDVNADSLTVIGSFGVVNALTLTTGIINTDSLSTITLKDGAYTTTGSANCYVNGPLKAEYTSNTVAANLKFPIGKAGIGNRYLTFQFDKTDANLTTYTAEYFPTGAPALTLTPPLFASPSSYWRLDSTTNNTFTNPLITVNYGANDYNGSITQHAFVKNTNASVDAWINITDIQPYWMPTAGTVSNTATLNANFTTLGMFGLAAVYNCERDFIPVASIAQSSCNGLTPNNDGSITAANFNVTDKFDVVIGSTYTGTATYWAGSTTVPSNGIVLSTIANPLTTQDYTVRFFNQYGCTKDTTVTISNANCKYGSVIAVAKKADTPIALSNGTFSIKYTVTVKNIGDLVATNVQVIDSLQNTFSGAAAYSVSAGPTIVSGSLITNTGFNGNTDFNLLTTPNTLAAGDSAVLIFTILLDPEGFAGPYANTAIGWAQGVAPDSSNNGTVANPDNDFNPSEVGENIPTTFYLQLPPVAVTDVATLTEDVSLNIVVTANSGQGISFNDTDPNGNNTIGLPTLITTGAFAPAHGIIDASGNYVPNLNYNGKDTVYYIICDATMPTSLCDTGIIILTINPVNDNPIAVDDIATTNEDVVVIINIVTNDSDVDGNGTLGSPTIIVNPQHGTVVVLSNGSIQYIPTANYNGVDTLTYQICDNNGLCDTALVIITINAVNDKPIAVDDAATVNEDASVVVTVIANDSDIEGNNTLGDPTIIVAPLHGTVTTINGVVTYTPDPNYNGSDSFTYQICDNAGLCDTAVVTVTVNPVNDMPIVANDNVTTTVNTVASGNITTNDNDNIDGTSISANTINIVQAAAHGSIVINTNGTYTYTPTTNYTGADTVVFSVCDNGLPLPIFCINDTLFITVLTPAPAVIGVAKHASTAQLQSDGTYTIQYTLVVKNYSTTSAIDNIQIVEDLNTAFPLPVTYTLVNTITKSLNSNLTLNSTFNGNIDKNILQSSISILAPLAIDTIYFSVNIALNTSAESVFENKVIVTGTDVVTGVSLRDTSNNGYDPISAGNSNPTATVNNIPTPVTLSTHAIIGAAKKVIATKFNESDGSFDITYSIFVQNYGNVKLNNIQVYENLYTSFPLPVQHKVDMASVVATGGFTTNVNFDKTTSDSLLLAGNASLDIGESFTITFTVNVKTKGRLGNVYFNSVTVAGTSNQGIYVSDVSTDGDNPNPINSSVNNPSEVGEDVPTPVLLMPSDIIIPNVITPNGDGINDYLIINNLEHFENNELLIFNRWGKEVYRMSDYANDWNGKSNQEAIKLKETLVTATYYYLISLNNGTIKKKGTIEVIY